ncbi:PAS domain S-box-containing protein [Pedobacter africanus]|uniref:PAS domain S-box-containing protein n=1 Tax=Pedobacter africanus TaxID=151894 RepID=A0ACC6L0H2_9SPHI|nr:PAS domain-containing protein [Pedobacter africanus]MDR6784859.1 PAS domain S-box-containing protein [Pedobacter africanus]
MYLPDAEDFHYSVLYAPIGICILDATTLIAEVVNEKFLEVAGKPYEAIYGQYYWDAFAEARQYYESALAGVARTGEAFHAEEVELMLIRHGQPEMIFVTFVYSPIKDGDGNVRKVTVWVLENTKQIAERQKELAAKIAFKAERDRLHSYFMKANAGICVLQGPDLVYELVNTAYQQILPGRELIGRPIFDALPELIGTPIQEMLLKVYSQGEPCEMNEVMIPVSEYEGGPTKDRYFSFTFQASRDEYNRIDGVVNFVFEVSEMILIQQELLKAREQADQQKRVYETITSGTPDLMYVWDLDYRFTYANSALLTMWGKTWNEAIGKGLRENGYEEWHAAMHEREIDHVRATKESVRGEVAFPHAILGRRIYDYILIPVLNENGEVEAVAGTTRDVTERTQLQEALARGTEELQAVNEELMSANEEQAASNEELKATNEELAIVNQQLIEARKKIEEAEAALRLAIEASDSGTFSINARTLEFLASARLKELFGFKADEDMPYEACMTQIREDYRPTVYMMVEAALTKGARFELEYPVVRFHDGKLRWLRGLGTLQHDSNGADSFFAGIIIDITEHKEDEQRKNDFIAMVSHELKTPLTSMKGYVQVLLAKLRQREDNFSAGLLEKANIQIAKMTNMINGFLNISRLESGKIHINLQEFDLAELIGEAKEESLTTIISHNVIFDEVVPTLVNADREKIAQVIHNLISNAVKYSPSNTTIAISATLLDAGVKVSVRDEGIGINTDDLPRIFDRYYRVEDNLISISGFGIGLYLCSEIIRRHNGEIWAESELGKGSVFNFVLPLVNNQ